MIVRVKARARQACVCATKDVTAPTARFPTNNLSPRTILPHHHHHHHHLYGLILCILLYSGTIAAILGAVFGVLLIGGLVAAGIVFYRRAKKRSVHYAGSPADLRLDDNQSSDGDSGSF